MYLKQDKRLCCQESDSSENRKFRKKYHSTFPFITCKSKRDGGFEHADKTDKLKTFEEKKKKFCLFFYINSTHILLKVNQVRKNSTFYHYYFTGSVINQTPGGSPTDKTR